jgi:hypothetical protein
LIKTCEDVIKHYETLCGVILSKILNSSLTVPFMEEVIARGWINCGTLRLKVWIRVEGYTDGIPEPDIL